MSVLGTTDILMLELELMLALLENVIDVGFKDDQGVTIYSARECNELWMKLASLEEHVDAIIAKEKLNA